MSEGQQYDNNNRGACWEEVKARKVDAEIDHRKFYGSIVAVGGSAGSSAPVANLWLRAKDNKNEVYCVAIFTKEGGGEKLAGGELTLLSGQAFWVSMFNNKSDKANSPARDLSFQPKEAQQEQQAEAEGPRDDDGVPF